jgi:plastocyanin
MLKHPLRGRRWLALLTLTAVLVGFSAVSALASSTKYVKVADSYFSVKKLTIRRGTRVTWNWVGTLYHNVTVRSGPSKFQSNTKLSGTYSHRFTRPGKYVLYCTLHRYMVMTVYVK